MEVWENYFSETVTTETETEQSRGDLRMLPQIDDYLDMEHQYSQIMFVYESGIQQIRAKLEILKREFQYRNDRNPIENVSSRIKSQKSIIEKMHKKGLPLTFQAMTHNLYDIAGVRVTCPFIQDVYQVTRMLLSQRDIQLVQMKDYIKNPKDNGYRSLHLVVLVEVPFSSRVESVPVEIQLRTIAMDCWASAEHQMRYKKDYALTEEMHHQLKECADLMAEADRKMQQLVNDLKL